MDVDSIGAPDMASRLEKDDAMNGDIIDTIHKNYPAAVRQTKNVAQAFLGNSRLETAQNIWDYLKHSIHYKKDPENFQAIRLPKRFVRDKTGDCKSFSLFTASIWANLYPNTPPTFRYAGYGFLPIPTHVYVTVLDENNNPIIIDGVYKKFNAEKKYNHKKDHKMKVYTLSGYDEVTYTPQGLGSIKDFLKKVATGVKKVGIAPARGAFLGLVALNVHGFATNLAEAIVRNQAAVKSMWEKLGGDFNQLNQTVNNGKLKQKIFGNDIGVIAPASLAALVAAAPVIIVVVKTLGDIIGKKKETADAQAQAEAGYLAETGVSPKQTLINEGLATQGGATPTAGSFFGSPLNTLIKGILLQGMGICGDSILLNAIFLPAVITASLIQKFYK